MLFTTEIKKHVCVGTQTIRAGTGIHPMHYALDKVVSHHSGRILKLFKAIEHLFDAWMDT